MARIPSASKWRRNASTEPRSFERGDPPSRTESPAGGQASTEPRSFERGDLRTARFERGQSLGFNGAALFRARRCQRLAESVLTPRGFNGAALFRARRCQRLAESVLTPRGFNGAALFRARRLGDVRRDQEGRFASTEPRSFERGDGPPWAAPSTAYAASTEPRSFERGDPVSRL